MAKFAPHLLRGKEESGSHKRKRHELGVYQDYLRDLSSTPHPLDFASWAKSFKSQTGYQGELGRAAALIDHSPLSPFNSFGAPPQNRIVPRERPPDREEPRPPSERRGGEQRVTIESGELPAVEVPAEEPPLAHSVSAPPMVGSVGPEGGSGGSMNLKKLLQMSRVR